MPKYSTERLTDDAEQVRRTLLWLIEQTDDEPLMACGFCLHDLTHHVEDDGGVGMCMFPLTLGAPFVLCRCSLFLDVQDEDDSHPITE